MSGYNPYQQPPPQYPPQGGYHGQTPQAQYSPPSSNQGSIYPPQQGGPYPYPQPQYNQYPLPANPPYGHNAQYQPPQQAPYGQTYGAPPSQQSYGYGAPPIQQPPLQHSYGVPTQAYPSPQIYTQSQGPPGSFPYGSAYIYAGLPPPHNISQARHEDAQALHSAMDKWGTDEKALIRILASRSATEIQEIAAVYRQTARESKYAVELEHAIRKEVSGNFQKGLLALVRGPLQHDITMLFEAMDGPGTKEKVLNDVLLGRSNSDIRALTDAYARLPHRKHHSLRDALRADLSMKTEQQFMIVLQGARSEIPPGATPNYQQVDHDVEVLSQLERGPLHSANQVQIFEIFARQGDAHIRAVAERYHQRYSHGLEGVIKAKFQGHMEDALIYQLREAVNPIKHQAQLIEDAMAGMGTKDELLILRISRNHYDPRKWADIRRIYEEMYGSLAKRIKGETSGDYERLLLAMIGGG